MTPTEGQYNSGMIDLDAPIVPGRSAAGVFVGTAVSELLSTVGAHTITKLSSVERHDLGVVKVWPKDGVITQVGVYSGYRGMVQPGIRVGSTISEVEESFRCSVQEDESDNLIVPTSPGWYFETEEWKSPQIVSSNRNARNARNARIVSIFVFASP